MKINEQVRQMHPPRYTTSQAAELVGRDIDTLRRWRQRGIYRPSHAEKFGKTLVPLYDDDDIRALRTLARTIRPGRKTA